MVFFVIAAISVGPSEDFIDQRVVLTSSAYIFSAQTVLCSPQGPVPDISKRLANDVTRQCRISEIRIEQMLLSITFGECSATTDKLDHLSRPCSSISAGALVL